MNMKHSELKLRQVYTKQMVEVVSRLNSASSYIQQYFKSKDESEFDSGVLQFRKALEAVAYASIAPNKEKYQAFRSKADTSKDFTKDFNATKIFHNLRSINKSFYPMPLIPARKIAEHQWHFERKSSGFLTEKRFQNIYDRLGKFLHADNPWGTNKNLQNLAKDIEVAIRDVRLLLELHAAFIQSKAFTGVWIVEVPKDATVPKITKAVAISEFCVSSS
ncbi:hypothetical protein SHAQ108633_14810 [Shewanella aquimarina]